MCSLIDFLLLRLFHVSGRNIKNSCFPTFPLKWLSYFPHILYSFLVQLLYFCFCLSISFTVLASHIHVILLALKSLSAAVICFLSSKSHIQLQFEYLQIFDFRNFWCEVSKAISLLCVIYCFLSCQFQLPIPVSIPAFIHTERN